MAAPSITVVDSSDRTVTNWDNGVVQANAESAILQIVIWNNRGGTTDLSDLKEANITALDVDGRAITEVVTDKWVRVNVPVVDGSTGVWTPVGGTTAKSLRADGVDASEGYVIKGIANDGSLANSAENYCSCNLKTKVPAGVSAGIRNWKMRINGYFT
jgi:hypothetical protein